MNLETAVERTREGCALARWQGATTQRVPARKAKPRRQRANPPRHRARSAFTHKVMRLVCAILSVHQMLPAKISAQMQCPG